MTKELEVAASVAIDVYRELLEDYVGLWALPWHVRRGTDAATDEEVRTLAASILVALLASGVAIGDMDETTGTFTPWASDHAAETAMAAWEALGRDPTIGEVAWLAMA